MKRILLALALVASVQVANAQIKSDADIQKAIDKAEATANDAKKGAKPAPWLKLGEAYVKAYTNPTANLSTGIDKQTFSLMAGEKPSAVENVTIDGQNYEKQVLSRSNVYFTPAGQLAFFEVTKPSVAGDPLEKAVKAYAKAFSLGAKDKEVDAALQNIVGYYYQDAITAYSLGNLAKATDLFGKAADASMTPPSSKVDTNAVYNSAFTALNAGNYARAKQYYNKCLDLGYTAEGSVFASLSNCALAEKDTTAAKQYLADGLKKYNLTEGETHGKQPLHVLVKVRLLKQSLRDRGGQKVCHISALHIHSGESRGGDGLLTSLSPIVILLADEIGDSPAVTHYQSFISPLIPEDVLKEPGGGAAGITLEAIVGEHDLLNPSLCDKVLESGEISLPKIPFGNVSVECVPQRLRTGVDSEMLGACLGLEMTIRKIALKAPHDSGSQEAGQVRILTVGLHSPAPAGIPKYVDIRGPESQAGILYTLTGLDCTGEAVFDPGLVADGREYFLYKLGIERSRHTYRHRVHCGIAVTGDSVKRLIPPVIGGNTKTGDGL